MHSLSLVAYHTQRFVGRLSGTVGNVYRYLSMTLDATPEYRHLRKTRKMLRWFATLVRAFCWLVGLSLFASAATKLLGTGFGLGERIELGVWGVLYLGGGLVCGSAAHHLFRAAADLVDLRVDQAVAGQRALAILESDVAPALRQLIEEVRSSKKTPSSNGRPADLALLTTPELIRQLRNAQRLRDADAVLDLREALRSRLDPAKEEALNRRLASWLSKHFQSELRAGKAPLVVAALGRAVEALAGLPEIQHLADALPAVRMSAGLCTDCGRPYRGGAGRCPVCQAESK